MKRKTELEGEIDKTTSIAGNLNIRLSVTDRTSHKKFNKDVEDLNNAIHKFDIFTKHCTNNCRICILYMYMFKFQRIAMQSMFFDHSGDKLKKKIKEIRESQNVWKFKTIYIFF